MSSVCLITDAGKERSVAATKSFTAQLTALLLLKEDVENINYQGKIEEISKWAKTYTEDFSILDPAVKKLREKIVILGDGYLYSIAMEAALKLRETANLTTDAFNLREYLHGPIRTLDRDTTVIILGRRSEENTEVVETVNKYAGAVVEIGDTDNADVRVLSVEDCLKPLVYAIPVQIMACRKTLSLGLNPDTPDKLTKVVR
jgi:Glucosamine 6-phosphate synthetase, contains amidotransferase and phosphosugar isomerase domains